MVGKLTEMLPEYYQLRGWDASGVPSRKKLRELALA
jgi:aldehyde:ferredoxin oxidoreductase